MRKQILILGRDYHPDGKETADTIFDGLKQVMKTDDYQLRLMHYQDLLFDIKPGQVNIQNLKTGQDLSEFDAVLMTNWFSHASIRKDMAHSLGLFWERNNIPFFNSEAFHNRSTSKLSQMVLAAYHGVNIPRTLFSLDFDGLAKQAIDEFGYPCIFKDANASRGQGNYLIKSAAELSMIKKDHTETHPFIAQTFIESGRVDYRFFVAGGKARLIIKRQSQGDSHVTNTSAGAASELLPPQALGDEILGLVEKCSKLFHRELTGIDIMIDKESDKSYFLEANPIPQIATGSNVEHKLTALAKALSEAADRKRG